MNKCPSGLESYGWNCYINSVLQCLASSRFILDFSNNFEKHDQDIIDTILKYDLKFCNDLTELTNKCDILIENKDKNNLSQKELKNIEYIKTKYNYFYAYICLKNIIEKINNYNETVKPLEFIEVSKLSTSFMFKHLFMGEQNDPAEFLAYLFDIIHYVRCHKVTLNFKILEENCKENKIINLYRKDYKNKWEKEYSLYVKNFIFNTMKTISCNKCEYLSYNFAAGHILELPIPNIESISIFDCLKEFTKKDRLDSDYKCDKCKENNTSYIENKILSNSNTLIIQFLRFSQTMTGSYKKNNNSIDYPLNLNIGDFILTNDKKNYSLYGVILHFGNINGGHYISFVKKFDETSKSYKWFKCDDENISLVEESIVSNNNNAYILFYQLED